MSAARLTNCGRSKTLAAELKRRAFLPFLVIANLGFLSAPLLFAQEGTPSPTPFESVVEGPLAEAERVIVTGSNIPTAQEVGPNPVDSYRRDDLARLGVRTPSDFIRTLPATFGAALNEGTTATSERSATISLRGIDAKETLVLQDGRRLATGGLFGTAVDFNVFPLGLIDHIDVLKDGASPVYGSDAVAGVVNVYLIHKFRGLEVYASYGNTNLGSANDMGQEIAYLLAGTGDEKTNFVVFAEYFNQAAIFSRDLDISRSLNYRDFGGQDVRSGNFAGRVDDFVYQPSRNRGAKSPTPHAYPNVASDPEYVPRLSLPLDQQLFNFAQFTPIIAPSDRQYYYGSFDRELCGKALTLFADFEFVRRFWGGVLAPRPVQPDIWTDSTHPFGISSSGFSVPIQNPFNPFTVPITSHPAGRGQAPHHLLPALPQAYVIVFWKPALARRR
jgi:outer membrane receptor protein involved in Fe transport